MVNMPGNSNRVSDSAACESPLAMLAASSVLPFSNTAGQRLDLLHLLHKFKPLTTLHIESSRDFILQSMVPFLLSGVGMVCAGLLLEHAGEWRLFRETPELYVLVPALLGLKGNLEMTLASRLSTIANLGQMKTRSQQLRVAYTNLALTQSQAIIVSFIAALFSIVVRILKDQTFHYNNAVMLCATSMATATLASVILGSIMITVVIVARSFDLNPDNIATPIAASVGDLNTLAILIGVGTLLLNTKTMDAPMSYLDTAIVIGLVLIAPLWMLIASTNELVRVVLKQGWLPVISAMMISSGGGFIFKAAIAAYPRIAIFQPVINGVGGNLVAVQASRISTSLHQFCKMGNLGDRSLSDFVSPFRAFYSNDPDAKAARILLGMCAPGHIIFALAIMLLSSLATSGQFLISYLAVGLIQVSILLYVCQWMVRAMWRVKIDPDSSAIPLLTAAGDLLGTALLTAAFMLLVAVNNQTANGDRTTTLNDNNNTIGNDATSVT